MADWYTRGVIPGGPQGREGHPIFRIAPGVDPLPDADALPGMTPYGGSVSPC